MEVTTKLAIGVSALCCLTTVALAGGPEKPIINPNGVHIGLGFGYKSYKYNLLQEDNTGGTLAQINNEAGTVTKFGPVGEIGYTCAGHRWLWGLKGQFEYDDVLNHTNDSGVAISEARIGLRSHLTAMVLGGYRFNEADTLYVEAGYTALFLKANFLITTSGGAAMANPPVLLTKYTLSGGIVGIGWRHYFRNNVFFDLSYDKAIYGNRPFALSFNSGAGWFQSLGSVKKTSITGVTATANFLFNV